MKLLARSTLALALASCAVLTAPIQAWAVPTEIGAGQTQVFNFDASALGPFAKVFVVTGFAEVGAPQSGGMWLYAGLNGTGIDASCQAFSDLGDCLPFIEGNDWAYLADFADGDFSLRVDSGQGSFTVDPYAKLYRSAGDTQFIRVDPLGLIRMPEPSTLALLGAAAAGALTRRRRAVSWARPCAAGLGTPD